MRSNTINTARRIQRAQVVNGIFPNMLPMMVLLWARAKTSVVKIGETLDRYGSPKGEYMSPADTSFDARSLPPGKLADPYSQYKVIKEFEIVAEKVAPAFGKDGGGVQIRAKIPEIENGFATVIELIRFGYLGEKK